MTETVKQEQPWDMAPAVSDEKATVSSGPWDDAPPVEPTVTQKAEAFSGSVVGGVAETAPAIALGTMGFKAGLAIAPAAGPFAPIVPPAMAALGFGVGHYGGKDLRSLLARGGMATESVESVDPKLRPYAVGGEVVGAGATMMTGTGLAAVSGARAPASKVGNWINRVLDTAVKHPKSFVSAEAAGIGGAAVGGAVAESYMPGEPLPRLGAELAGGFFNPTRLVVGASSGVVGTVKRVTQSMSKTGKEAQAAKVLQDIVRESGEDPIALAKALRESDLLGLDLTAAQKTGSPALIALEAKLATESARFGAESRKTAEDGLETIKRSMAALTNTGDPSALKAAAEMRGLYFRTLIASRLQNAERAATEAAGKLSTDTPQARSFLAKEAHELIDAALGDVRTVERQLWSQVPKDVSVRAENTVLRYDELRNELLPEEVMPPVIEGFIQRMKIDRGPDGKFRVPQQSDSGEMMRFRSRALALAREADAKGNLNEARMLGNIAEAVLDDLDTISVSIPQYDAARSFSRELNQVFTSTFAGDAMRSGARGQARIPPELMLRKALGAGKETGALKLKQLADAAAFLEQRGIDAPDHLSSMLSIQDRFIRLAAADSINPNTGRVSADRLSKFARDNEEILGRFPEVKKTITEAVKSENVLQDMQRMVTHTSRVLETQTAFARVLKYDSPADAVRSALRGTSPTTDLTAMVRLAKKGGSNAVDGLRASVMENAIRQSGGTEGLSFTKLRSNLFDPVRPGQPSVMQTMTEQGVITDNQIKGMKELFNSAEKIEQALVKGSFLETLVQNPDAMFDLVIRVAGAKLGGVLSQAGPMTRGAPLIAAARGSAYAREVFGKVPQARIKDVLIEAASNPKFAAMLLEKPATQKEAVTLGRQMHAYLLQAGITIPENDE